MLKRYEKNIGFISEECQNTLLTKTIAVIGVGGNGGYIAEFLARQGLKKLIIIDPDIFEETNLNRQVFCTEHTLYLNKAKVAVEYLQKINSSVEYKYYDCYFGQKEIPEIEECDMIISAADGNDFTPKYREALKQLMIRKNIPVIEQAVRAFGVEISISHKDNLALFDEITTRWQNAYKESQRPDFIDISQPAWLCSLAASLAVAEVWKWFSNDINNYELTGKRIVYNIFEHQCSHLIKVI